MGSRDSNITPRQALAPIAALTWHEVRTLASGWLVRLWIIGALLLVLTVMAGTWQTGNTQIIIASVLFPFLVFPWPLVVALIGVGPPGGTRGDILVDSILTRPVTRHGVIIASWLARLSVVLVGYLIVALPAVLFVISVDFPPSAFATPVTGYGIFAAMGIVAMTLVAVVSLGFVMGTLLGSPFIAVVVLIFGLLPVNFALSATALKDLSPTHIQQALPGVLTRSITEPADTDEQEPSSPARSFSALLQAVQSPGQSTGTQTESASLSVGTVFTGYGAVAAAALAGAVGCFMARDP